MQLICISNYTRQNSSFWGHFYALFYKIGELRADRKVLGGERGAGSTKDLYGNRTP